MGVVIVGAGQGGFQVAASLRAEGYQESITLIGDEPHLPYQRPPLSKGMLLGKQQARHAMLRPAAFYESHNIELVTGERVTAIDPAGRSAVTESRRIEYDALVLATGARNVALSLPGASLEGVVSLRSLDESEEIRERIASASDVVVIGGGFIGLEVAAAARLQGKAVTVIEVRERLMARVVAPAVSEHFRAQHTAQGVEILLNAQVAEIRGDAGRAREVILRDGSRHAADLMIVGVGVLPNAELTRAAGLAVGNGIVVDEHLRTADKRIFAIGDCAEFPSAFTGQRVRLESVQNAVDQGTSVARAIVGLDAPYASVPWFWTDQFDVHLQLAGLTMGFDQTVTRGDPDSGRFSEFYYRAGKLIAVNSINRAAEHLTARKLIGAGGYVSPEQAADEDFDLKELVGAAR